MGLRGRSDDWPNRAGGDAHLRGRQVQADVVLYEGTYPGWPWITRGRDGGLYCVFREGTEHDFSATGRALLCRSRDAGRSWSKAAVIVDTPGVDDRNVAISILGNGDLLVVFNTYTSARESLARVVRSSNGGRTWLVPRKTNVQSRRATSPPQICRHNKTPTLLFADRHMVSVSMVKTTDPEFLAWDIDHRLAYYLYQADESPMPDGSYPVSVQTGPRERFVVD